ncbi:hypothetical protein L7F22_016303 [Adiantum nelumboides]|nr:hypothetical protein [Adiantum nelumboides]
MSPPLDELISPIAPATCTLTHVLPATTHHLNITRPNSSDLSENNILMQCMQKLAGRYPPAPTTIDPRMVLQESNGQMMITSSAKGDGCLEDQHGGGSGNGCTPRPRWCPTPEQIQVLEALFNSGTTTPSRDMIVEIADCLKQFGSIVEANVFYWFQNRKARAKRKLRMQAQLQQQASTSPSDSNDCSSTQNGKSSATSRRVCAKTACKNSPGADHYQLPSLMHLPTGAQHSNQYHPNSLITPACGGLIMPLQVINNTTSCKFMSSSNAEHPPCAFSNTSLSQIHEKHGHNHVISITSEHPPPFADRMERTDHHGNNTQNHTDYDPYNNHMTSATLNVHFKSVASSSRPGSTGSSDALAGNSCPPTVAQENGAANVLNMYKNPHAISTFLGASSDQTHYTAMPAADMFSNLALTSSSSALYNNVDRSATSLSMPNKRSWMDALMQEFNASTEPSPIDYTSTSSDPSNIMPNAYDMSYRVKPEMHNINNDPNHVPIDLNLLLQRPQMNPTQGSSINTSLTTFSRLDSGMAPATQLSLVMQEDMISRSASNTASCKEQPLQNSSPPQPFHQDHQLHWQDNRRIRDPQSLESLMSSSSTSYMLQQPQQNHVAYIAATSSPPKDVHHCDNLPLWEALAPYMRIGS